MLGRATAGPLLVELEAGAVRGVRRRGVRMWRGIPYAASTAGDGRFRAPRPVPGWNGVRDAAEFGPVAPQKRKGQFIGAADHLPRSEDCLTVNVTAPDGTETTDRGLPVINGFRWDTGAQVHGVNGAIEWTGAITTGSLSNPRLGDDNGGRQLAGRAVLRPSPAVALGASVSRGAFLSRSVESVLQSGIEVEDGVQQAIGIDAEYSAGHFLGRSEVIWSQWLVPIRTRGALTPLEAMAFLIEGRYRVLPGVHVAARAERLGFNRLQTTAGLEPWEAPVRRFEVGGGYAIIRNVIVKASWQRNIRDEGRVRDDSLAALQIVYWF